jgi:hypothetical protein
MRDIETTRTIVVPDSLDLSLMGAEENMELKRVTDGDTLDVCAGASLTIGNITVTHSPGAIGRGVRSSGTLLLSGGSISWNRSTTDGAGVKSTGEFKMSSGSISGNRAINSGSGYTYGGGVSADSFDMTGGNIYDNESRNGYGGGVYVSGAFNMSGGSICYNKALGNSDASSMGIVGTACGGGVYAQGLFNMTGGRIYCNQAAYGAGVYCPITGIYSTDVPGWPPTPDVGFNMYGGKVFDNTAIYNGGGVWSFSHIRLKDGTISNNTARKGGGVWAAVNSLWPSAVEGGVISDNRAWDSGGGMYLFKGMSQLGISGAAITGNYAVNDGGGIWIDRNDLAMLGIAANVTFSGNQARRAYDRKPEDDSLYESKIKCTAWTSPFTQGYNNYDISYTDDPVIPPDEGEDGGDALPGQPSDGGEDGDQVTDSGDALSGPNTDVVEDDDPNQGDKKQADDQAAIVSLTKSVVSVESGMEWTGKQIRSGFELKIAYKANGKAITKYLYPDIDYTFSGFGKNKNIGKGTVTIKAKPGGAYTGSKTVAFSIVPKAPSGFSMKPAKAALKLTWGKPSKSKEQKITRYQVQYRTKGTSKWKTKSFSADYKSKAKTVTKLLKLKSNKTYQLQVRSYKSVGGITYFSEWTPIKSKRTK